jgi:hypothetical protein
MWRVVMRRRLLRMSKQTLVAALGLVAVFALIGSRDAYIFRWHSQDERKIVITVKLFNQVQRGMVDQWTAGLGLNPLTVGGADELRLWGLSLPDAWGRGLIARGERALSCKMPPTREGMREHPQWASCRDVSDAAHLSRLLRLIPALARFNGRDIGCNVGMFDESPIIVEGVSQGHPFQFSVMTPGDCQNEADTLVRTAYRLFNPMPWDEVR